MPTSPSTFPKTFAAQAISAGRKLAGLTSLFAPRATAHSSSNQILPIGCIQIRESGGAFRMMLRDCLGRAASGVAMHVTDNLIAGALLTVHGLPRGQLLTVEPPRPVGGAALCHGDGLLIFQPPPIGHTDIWALQLQAPSPQANASAIVARLIVEVSHWPVDGATEATAGAVERRDGPSSDSSIIVVRIQPG